MDCKNSYLKQKIPYLLCKLEPEPTGYNKKELFHAVCAHQAHCPKENCHKNTPGWVNCIKLREKPQEAVQERFDEAVQEPQEEQKVARRRTRKPKTEE